MALGRSARAVYFHRKSADAQETGAKNEDAIAWQVNPSGEIISFTVCDGVGGSYLGYIASNYLAAMLVGALNGWAEDPPADTLTAPTLRDYLDSWKDEGRIWVEKQQISFNANPALVEVVKNRERHGSHTVFFCGYVDCRAGGASLFAWMGNVHGQVFGKDGQGLLDTSTMADDRVRWTTKHGCLGTPNLKYIPTDMIGRVLVFSDGLEKIAEQLTGIGDAAEDAALVRSLAGQVFSDDASLFSIWPSPGVTSAEGATQLPIDESLPPDNPEQPLELNIRPGEGQEATDASDLSALQDLPVWEQNGPTKIWRRIKSIWPPYS